MKGKVEDILDLLDELGELTDILKKRIQQETDLQVLRKWHKEAARAESVSEFESKMDVE